MFRELQKIRDHVRIALGISSSTLVDTQIDEYINLIYRDVLPQVLQPPELRNEFYVTLIAGTGDYRVDADMLSILGPSYIGTDPIFVTTDAEWFWKRARDRESESSSKPHLALLFANEVKFYPIPDDNYNFYTVALARPDKLENDTDTIFNESWFMAVVYHTAARITYNWGDYEAYQAHTREGMGAVSLARREQLARRTGQRAMPSF